jgi:hypothetical protein
MEIDGELYWLWPNGDYCEAGDYEFAHSKSDDYVTVSVVEWDDDGEPMFPGGLR